MGPTEPIGLATPVAAGEVAVTATGADALVAVLAAGAAVLAVLLAETGLFS